MINIINKLRENLSDFEIVIGEEGIFIKIDGILDFNMYLTNELLADNIAAYQVLAMEIDECLAKVKNYKLACSKQRGY
jgi:hypothetical protein